MRAITKVIGGLFFLGALFISMSTAAHAENKLKLKTAIIYATKSGQMDPKIKKVTQKSLSATFGAYKGFTLLDQTADVLTEKKAATVLLPTNQKAVVSLIGKKGRAYQLKLDIPKHKVKVKLSAPPKKLFYQAGIPYKKGRLILAFYLKE